MMHFTAVRGAGRGGFAARKITALWLLGFAAALLSACGGSSTSQSVIAVSTPQLKTIAIDPPDPTLALGLTTQFTATGIYTDGSQQDLSQSVTWSSSNPAVASVSNGANANGLTTAVSQGTTTITATLGLVSGKATLTVTAAALEFIAVTPTQSSVAKGGTQQFTATGIYSDHSIRDLTTTVTWASSAPGVATISNATATYGLATGVSVGTTTITAALSNLSGSTTLMVTATTLKSIAVTPVNASIVKGTTQQFTATGTFADGTTQNLTGAVSWTSGTPAVATINTAGLATAVNIGATLVTATLGSVSGSTGLTVVGVTVTLQTITVTPVTASLTFRANQPQPSTQAFTATGHYSDGTTQNLTATATWTSSLPTTVASISNAAGTQGIATAVGLGTTSITATQGGITSNAATLTVTAATQYVYVADFNNPTVYQYSIDGASGALTPLTPATESAGVNPFSLAVDPTGTYLYAGNWYDKTISQYQIGAGGVLNPIGTTAPVTGANPNGVTVDPSGRFVYVANFYDSTVSQYSVTTGLLTPILTPPATGIAPTSVAVDSSGTYAYVTNYGNTNNPAANIPGSVSEYVIGGNGALTPIGTVTAGVGVGANDIVIAPGTEFAYVVNQVGVNPPDGTVSLYSIGANGALAFQANVATGLNGPRNIAFATTVTGRYAYVTNRDANTVVEYSVSPTTGLLTQLGSVPALGAEGISVDAAGKFVYVTDRYGPAPALSEFSINADGTLTSVGTIQLPGATPTGIVTAY